MRKWIKHLFCKHSWRKDSKERYNVIDVAGQKEGEVSLECYTCIKCNRIKLFASDRTHVNKK